MKLILGDCLASLKELPADSVDSVVTDPPYELGFMGKSWDSTGIAFQPELWAEVLRVLKPGGHLLSFSGSRTYHRMAVAIEDAGFEIRDQIMWIYGSGFPKSHNIEKAINKVDGVEFMEKPASGVGFMNAEGAGGYNTTINQLEQVGDSTDRAKQWQGWGTALKPAHEPIVVARKPVIGTVANNVLTCGVGGLNIDGARVAMGDEYDPTKIQRQGQNDGVVNFGAGGLIGKEIQTYKEGGRWPANVIHDGSDEVVALFPDTKSGLLNSANIIAQNQTYGARPKDLTGEYKANSGSAARFFYCAKASKHDRNEGLDGFEAKQQDQSRKVGNPGGDNPRNRGVGERLNHHPTVKPIDLMRYLCRLITPPNGTILDPFMGSGSTGKAAVLEGFDFIGMEQSEDYLQIAQARIAHAESNKGLW